MKLEVESVGLGGQASLQRHARALTQAQLRVLRVVAMVAVVISKTSCSSTSSSRALSLEAHDVRILRGGIDSAECVSNNEY